MATPNRTAASTFDRVANDLTHAPFPDLAAAIRAEGQIDRILNHWRDLSLQAMPHLNVLTLEEFEDTIGEILAAAADAMESSDPQQLRGVIDSGPQHGIDRFVQKQSLLDLFEELRILRGVTVVEIAEQLQRPLSVDEAASFHAIFDIIIQQGVMALVQNRNTLLEQLQATTREMNEQLMKATVRQDELLEQAKAMQEKIDRQAEKLADESRRKDEFLAMLSHELRNPLAPIRAAVHLLKTQERGSENAIQKQAREIIDRQANNLNTLITDLLEVSRVISGRVHLNQEIVDLGEVLRHAMETVMPLIEQHKHELVAHRCDDESAPVWCNADATRMEEVFINLLRNAAKYTPDGGRIEVRCEGPDRSSFAQVRIRDNGMGIDKELLPKIFDLFTQGDCSLARSGGGLGIGLSLSHRIVELHGGAIEAHSPPQGSDVGSEFIVKLPTVDAPDVPQHHQPEGPAAKANGRRVLIVDDNIDLATLLAVSLRHKGHTVQCAHNGPDGLEIAQQWKPNVVLLDIGLPGLSGYDVARQLRAADSSPRPAGTKAMRLIASTGYGRDTDVSRAKEAGFDAHLVKPYDLDVLEALLIHDDGAASFQDAGTHFNV